jgi:iron complex transport system ATP-binding protein
VGVRYPGAAAPALTDVDLHVADGAFHAVLGPNGSGKSTLMRALLGTLGVDRGEILLDGRPPHRWKRRELAREVGAVPQNESIPFPVSSRELVAMGRYPHLGALQPEKEGDRAAVARALAECEVEHLAERNVQTLSGGELQRVRIARALAQEPRALVLDEPTASLDIRHEMAILELLRASADRGRTVLLVTHHLDLAARYADRILLMDCGRVAAEGTPAEVYREEILARVYRWPVEVVRDTATGSPRVVPRSGGQRG